MKIYTIFGVYTQYLANDEIICTYVIVIRKLNL